MKAALWLEYPERGSRDCFVARVLKKQDNILSDDERLHWIYRGCF